MKFHPFTRPREDIIGWLKAMSTCDGEVCTCIKFQLSEICSPIHGSLT